MRALLFLYIPRIYAADAFGEFSLKSELTTYSNTLLFDTVYELVPPSSSVSATKTTPLVATSTSTSSLIASSSSSPAPISSINFASSTPSISSTPSTIFTSPTESSTTSTTASTTSSASSTLVPTSVANAQSSSSKSSSEVTESTQWTTVVLTEFTENIVTVTDYKTSTTYFFPNSTTPCSTTSVEKSTDPVTATTSASTPAPTPVPKKTLTEVDFITKTSLVTVTKTVSTVVSVDNPPTCPIPVWPYENNDFPVVSQYGRGTTQTVPKRKTRPQQLEVRRSDDSGETDWMPITLPTVTFEIGSSTVPISLLTLEVPQFVPAAAESSSLPGVTSVSSPIDAQPTPTPTTVVSTLPATSVNPVSSTAAPDEGVSPSPEETVSHVMPSTTTTTETFSGPSTSRPTLTLAGTKSLLSIQIHPAPDETESAPPAPPAAEPTSDDSQSTVTQDVIFPLSPLPAWTILRDGTPTSVDMPTSVDTPTGSVTPTACPDTALPTGSASPTEVSPITVTESETIILPLFPTPTSTVPGVEYYSQPGNTLTSNVGEPLAPDVGSTGTPTGASLQQASPSTDSSGSPLAPQFTMSIPEIIITQVGTVFAPTVIRPPITYSGTATTLRVTIPTSNATATAPTATAPTLTSEPSISEISISVEPSFSILTVPNFSSLVSFLPLSDGSPTATVSPNAVTSVQPTPLPSTQASAVSPQPSSRSTPTGSPTFTPSSSQYVSDVTPSASSALPSVTQSISSSSLTQPTSVPRAQASQHTLIPNFSSPSISSPISNPSLSIPTGESVSLSSSAPNFGGLPASTTGTGSTDSLTNGSNANGYSVTRTESSITRPRSAQPTSAAAKGSSSVDLPGYNCGPLGMDNRNLICIRNRASSHVANKKLMLLAMVLLP